ncbi:MAG: hypothetical protein FWF03_08285 [Defluviitaleaceae bacterium]|nr:hypothetical protein [Defluviitaleaceae bacterium]
MGGFTSLATAVSGIRAAQTGLAVTGHNMANSPIYGYSRQRVLQKDFYYQTVSTTPYGVMKRGLGTDLFAIEQIRNHFLDITYRNVNTKLNFYTVKATVGAEIESMLGEMQGAYNFQSVINDMWEALQELSKHPDGIETRDKFLATCHSFITKSNEVYNSLFDYQHRLDEQIRDMVKEINELVSDINKLNDKIKANEAAGDNANDYRDERNRCLDRLSALLPLEYKEDAQGAVNITVEGHQLLIQGNQNILGLRYCANGYGFVEPVFTSSGKILSANTPPDDFESLFNYNKTFNAFFNNDNGALKALIYARGACPVYYNGMEGLFDPETINPDDPASGVYVADPLLDPDAYKQLKDYYEAAKYNYWIQDWSVKYAMIPQAMQQLDSIVNSIVRMINDAVAPFVEDPPGSGIYVKDPDAPYDLHGNQSYVEIFTRIGRGFENRFDEDGVYIGEEPGNYYSQYSIGNIRLNPLLLDTEGGYNYMAFSLSGDREDNILILEMLLDRWNDPEGPYAIEVNGIKYGIQDAYQKFVVHLGLEVEEAINFVNAQSIQVMEAEKKRDAIMGVSMDEELSNMMKYQYAFQSAARILNVIDSMIDTVVNRMGRSGL